MMLERVQHIIINPEGKQHKMGYKVEHRRAARVSCLVPVDGKSGSAFDDTQTVDISKGGIGFISQRPVSLNEKIAIEIEFDPDQEPAIVMGKVLWVSQIENTTEYRIGMEFGEALLEGSKARLKKYIEE